MIHKCAVVGCPNKSDTIIHYTLPEELNRRRQWIRFMERGKKLDVSVSSRICGSHFSEDCFTKLDLGFTTRLILSVNAIPTIYPEELNESNHVSLQDGPAGESCFNGTEMSSLPFLKEPNEDEMLGAPIEEEMLGAPIEEEMAGEPVEDDLSDEPFNIIKIEPQNNGYINSSFEQTKSDQHQLSPGDGKPFNCAYCGEGFFNKGVLKQHELKHKTVAVSQFQKEYHCYQCGRDFTHKAFLKAHQKVHASVESQMSFSCTKCNRRFRKKSSLNRHMRNHLDRSNYPCPVCGEEFELKGSLHNHIRSHPGERFLCSYCKQRFLKIDAYLKHVDRHTVVTPYYCEQCKVYQLTERGFMLHQRRHSRRDLEIDPTETGPAGLKRGRPLKNNFQIPNLPRQIEAKPKVGSEPNLTLETLGDADGSLLEKSGEDSSHETTGPSDEAEEEEEEDDEDELQEALDGSLEESTEDDHGI